MDDEEFELLLMHKFAYELDPDLWDEQEQRHKEDQAKIPYVNDSDMYIDRIKYPNKRNLVCSAVCGPYTYGGEHGQIEIMGLLTPEEEECDSVTGYLTADDVFQRIKKHYVSKGGVIKALEEKPQGDLISREALKKAIMNDLGLGDEENGSDAEYMFGLQDCYNLIDNAPAVSPYKAIHDELHKGEEE